MLHQARESGYGPYHNVFSSTRGIIFLGTPHRGSGYAQISRVGEAVAWLWGGMNTRVLRSLRYDSEILDRVNRSFLRTIEQVNTGGTSIRICSFAEELALLKLFSVSIHPCVIDNRQGQLLNLPCGLTANRPLGLGIYGFAERRERNHTRRSPRYLSFQRQR
jgi:hypothetical protein